MLAVDLGKAEHLRVGEFASQLFFHVMEVTNLFGTERQTFLLIVGFKIFYILNGRGLVMNGEDVLVETVIEALKHRVVVGILACHGEILLYTRNAAETHILSNLYGIRTPRCDHFAARPNILARQAFA